jgi:crossover junction endodeoxyribonuclease RuvC
MATFVTRTRRGRTVSGDGSAGVSPSRAAPSRASSPHVILGLDPGLERTGYAVLSAPAGRVLDAGLIRTSPRGPLAQRLAELVEGLDELLDERAVDLVAVEELFAHYKHPRTAILMGHARGALLLTVARRGLEIVGLSATRIKRALTGNGHASKMQVQRAIMATLGLPHPPEPSDVADAMAAAWSAAVMRRDFARRRLDTRR